MPTFWACASVSDAGAAAAVAAVALERPTVAAIPASELRMRRRGRDIDSFPVEVKAGATGVAAGAGWRNGNAPNYDLSR